MRKRKSGEMKKRGMGMSLEDDVSDLNDEDREFERESVSDLKLMLKGRECSLSIRPEPRRSERLVWNDEMTE